MEALMKKEQHDEGVDVHLMVHGAAMLRVRNVRLSVKGSEECAGDGRRLLFPTLSAARATNVCHIMSE